MAGYHSACCSGVQRNMWGVPGLRRLCALAVPMARAVTANNSPIVLPMVASPDVGEHIWTPGPSSDSPMVSVHIQQRVERQGEEETSRHMRGRDRHGALLWSAVAAASAGGRR